MALTLAEHSKVMLDPMDRGVVKTWLMHFPFLRALNVKNVPGLTRAWLVEQRLPSVSWRSLNSAFTESTGAFERRQTSLGLLGGLLDFDRRLVRDPTRIDEVAAHTSMMARAIGYELAYQLISGSVTTDPTTFDGLSRLATELNNRSSRSLIDASGLDLTTAAQMEANGDALLDYVFQAINWVEEGTGSKPSFLVMSSKMRRTLRSIARRLGYLKTTADSFDREVDRFDGVPIYISGWRVQGNTATEIITDTFDGNGYTSIFAVNSSDETTSMIQQGDLDKEHIGPTENGVWDRWKMEQAVGLEVRDNYSVVRLQGLDITV